MAQPQQVIDPNVNPPPTEQELLEYRVKMDRLTSAFLEEVQVRGVNAYTKLIHELKITFVSIIQIWWKLTNRRY